jgi:flagellar biosynthetic protein FliQ
MFFPLRDENPTRRFPIFTLLLIAAPIMLVGLIVGVAIALVQALTQIQEMTLVFVPKIIAIFIAILVALPFIGATLGGFMTRVAAQISSIG